MSPYRVPPVEESEESLPKAKSEPSVKILVPMTYGAKLFCGSIVWLIVIGIVLINSFARIP